MNLIKDNMTVKDALKYLAENGIEYDAVYFRTLISEGVVKSTTVFNSRVVPKSELDRIIDKKNKRSEMLQ